MKDTRAAELLIKTIQEYMGYDYADAFLYAIELTETCSNMYWDMYVEDLKKENK